MLTPVPPGPVGAVVTILAMAEPPRRPVPASPLRMRHWAQPAPEAYRALFRAVGGRWLWYSRLAMDDAELTAQLGEVHVVEDPDGSPAGLVELEFPAARECLIRFLGLVPELAGRGHGGWLMAETLRLAWRPGVEEVRVSTCSLDHPAALPAYLKAGFTAVRRVFESFPDPRLAGLLPPGAAPQLPVIRP